MTEGSHQDNMLIVNVVKDVIQPSRRSTLYMIRGGEVNFYRSTFERTFCEEVGGLGWGMGLEIRAGDRFFISPQFRLGRGPHSPILLLPGVCAPPLDSREASCSVCRLS